MLSCSPWPPVVCVGILPQSQARGGEGRGAFLLPGPVPSKTRPHLLSFHNGCLTAGTTRIQIRQSRSKESWEAPRNLKTVTGRVQMCLASSTEATRECEQDTLSVPQFPQLQPRGNQRTCPTGPSRGPNDAEDREKARLETGARYSLSALWVHAVSVGRCPGVRLCYLPPLSPSEFFYPTLSSHTFFQDSSAPPEASLPLAPEYFPG